MRADEQTLPVTTSRSAARVVAVAASREHRFSKQTAPVIRLVEGLGVEGDAHSGVTDQHRSHARRDPTRPNLRQVHLLRGELFEELLASGHRVLPGDLGENVTTYGIDLPALPVDTLLLLGPTAEVQVTGCATRATRSTTSSPGCSGRSSPVITTARWCAGQASWASCVAAARSAPATR